jgi:hypothetical protein
LEQRISKLSLDKENKLKEGMEAYQGRGYCVYGGKKERRRGVRKIFKSLCVERCSWKRCVQESNMERNCV